MNTLAPSFFYSINLILTGNEDMHESLYEFKFGPDTTTKSRVICPCTSEKMIFNVVNTLAPTFSIGSSSFLQVTRTTYKSGQSSNFGQIGPRGAELRPLIDVCNSFLLNILRIDEQNLTKFCIPFIIDKIYVCIVKGQFLQICNGVTALGRSKKLFLLNILGMDRQNLNKFCMHIIIDKVYLVL